MNDSAFNSNFVDNSVGIYNNLDFDRLTSNLSTVYNSSVNYWNYNSLIKNNTTTGLNSRTTTSPLASNNVLPKISSFDRPTPTQEGETPAMLKGKEESAPGYIFDTY
jgi:hypothetical protein